jgi:hypothetical protein
MMELSAPATSGTFIGLWVDVQCTWLDSSLPIVSGDLKLYSDGQAQTVSMPLSVFFLKI